MSRTLNSDFILEADKFVKDPIRLFIVEGGSLDTDEILRYAEYGENVTFSGMVYYKAPVRCESMMSENISQEVDEVQVSFGNVDRSFVHYLESHDGLRKCKVTIRTVFKSLLANNQAYNDNVYWVASSSMTKTAAMFNLKSKLDLFNVEVPMRKFYRSTCQWRFKSSECGYSGIVATCNHTTTACEALNNISRFGGFPGTGNAIRRVYVG